MHVGGVWDRWPPVALSWLHCCSRNSTYNANTRVRTHNTLWKPSGWTFSRTGHGVGTVTTRDFICKLGITEIGPKHYSPFIITLHQCGGYIFTQPLENKLRALQKQKDLSHWELQTHQCRKQMPDKSLFAATSFMLSGLANLSGNLKNRNKACFQAKLIFIQNSNVMHHSFVVYWRQY